ncbi:MAE1 [Candida pseudojiufengensis]|uniref:MAE1 n=1 Tax=Candida pseudojiufengensis TaxID=497109 RepID=UPI002225760C|nr:MAE1 [Candida pseudojiufengensis]KAI5963071.1 MAE1 [Candida pseudojiufengensis]
MLGCTKKSLKQFNQLKRLYASTNVHTHTIKTPIGLDAAIQELKPKATRISTDGAVECPLTGFALLNSPFLNKGSAFTNEERKAFDLIGMLPTAINTLDEQVDRAYGQFKTRINDLAKNSFMDSLRLQNKVLFYELVRRYVKEMLPIIYTPTIGDAIENYSQRFRKPEGLFLSIDSPDTIEESLAAFGSADDIDVVICSDGGSILGIGDWGGVAGSMIAVGKGSIVVAAGGIQPHRILTIGIDVGTDRKSLLEDPLYLGLRKDRVRGPEYYKFMNKFVTAFKKQFPKSVLHFEDFQTEPAKRLLHEYRDKLPCFNDDMQGTGCVVVASLKAALKYSNREITDSKILIYGAGSAGMGIASQIVLNLVQSGLTEEEARSNIYLMDRFGLITNSTESTEAQKPFAKPDQKWEGINTKNLVDVVEHIKPTVLIGCSTQPKAFNENVIKTMYKYNPQPIVFPLSNPTRLHEAFPEDIMKWTNNNALIATGSPFKPVDGYAISENNNCFAFPGLLLGSVLSRASTISDFMISAAVDKLSDMSPKFENPKNGLLPDISKLDEVSAHLASTVVLAALEEGVARIEQEHSPNGQFVKVPRDPNENLEWVRSQMWSPVYRPYVKVEYDATYHTSQY